MKRAGFTMIELIFVIVILGILSAVALPKFIGVSEQAEAGKCKALIGTLNRTTLPALWSDAILNKSGAVVVATDFSPALIGGQLEIPAQCPTAADITAALGGTAKTVNIGAYKYIVDLNISPSRNESPILNWKKGAKI